MPRGIPNKPKTIIEADAPTLGEAMSATVETKQTESVTEKPVKKGRRSWGRRDILGVTKKDPNFTYRWVRKEAGNIAQKLADGWEYCSDVVNEKAIHMPTEQVYGNVDLTSNRETRDSILMRLPNELKAERDEWLNEENAKVSGMIQQDVEKSGVKGALKGSVNIQGGTYQNIIE